MRKLIILFIPIFILTGCSSKEELFTKTCTNEVSTNEVNIKEKKEITYSNEDVVKKEVITKSYKADEDTIISIKKAADDYNNEISKSDSIVVRVITDKEKEYVVKYDFDVTSMTDEEINSFNIMKNSIKYLNKLEDSGLSCK